MLHTFVQYYSYCYIETHTRLDNRQQVIDLLSSCLTCIQSMLLDLDRGTEDDKQHVQHESEKCDCYAEEVLPLEKQYGHNVQNIQR